MNRRIAKKINANLPRYIWPGEPYYGRYNREQVRRMLVVLFPPGLRFYMPRTPMVESSSLAGVKVDDQQFLKNVGSNLAGSA